MQTRNTTQGVRYKKSIAQPRCISGPFSMATIPESLALRWIKTAIPRNKYETQNWPLMRF